MRILSILFVLILATVAVAEDPSYTNTTIWTHSVSGTNIPVYRQVNTDALNYYTDLSTFEAANPGLTPEDYSSTLLPPNSAQPDTGPLDYYCDNSLFALHTIVQGISLWEQTEDYMIVLTPPFAGVTSVSVGPNDFSGNAVYYFTLPTRAFGCFMVMPNGAASVDIEVFGVGGSIGTTTASGAPAGGAFWGVSSYDETIVKINFNCPSNECQLFSNVQFGLPTAIHRATWGELKACFQ